MDPTSLEHACEFLRAHGFKPFFVLDEAESVDFKARFPASPLGRLDGAPLVETRLGPKVRIYDPAQRTAAAVAAAAHDAAMRDAAAAAPADAPSSAQAEIESQRARRPRSRTRSLP